MWAEIDLGAISHNIALIRERAGRPIKLLVPVKANAYGHGAAVVGRHLETLAVEGLATANVDDAIAIRRAGATLPILLYGAQLPAGNRYLLEHDLTPTLYSEESLRSLSGLAAASGRTINVHVKVDAGMGRLGVRLDDAVRHPLACRDAGAERAAGRDLHAHPVLGCHWPGVVATTLARGHRRRACHRDRAPHVDPLRAGGRQLGVRPSAA